MDYNDSTHNDILTTSAADTTLELFEREETPLLVLRWMVQQQQQKQKQQHANSKTNKHHANEANNADMSETTKMPPAPDGVLLDLTLRQYPSDDDRWGIHSCVWDGGIAMLAYLLATMNNDGNTAATTTTTTITTVVELGAGTGVVGLGLAKLFREQQQRNQQQPNQLDNVYLTDLPEVLPLLEENIQLNNSAAQQSLLPTVQKFALDWCEEECKKHHDENNTIHFPWQHQITTTTEQQQQQHHELLLMGADIVYRPNLFLPLLHTILRAIQTQATAAPPPSSASSVRVLLACHSIRSYLHQFWQQARQFGFQVCYKASVGVQVTTNEQQQPQQSINGSTNNINRSIHLVHAADIQWASNNNILAPEDAPIHNKLTTIVELKLC